MKRTPILNIIIPVENYEEAWSYYRDTLDFPECDGLLLLPVEYILIGIKIVVLDEEDKFLFPLGKRYMSFSYEIEKNFLSYCLNLYKKGAIFDVACRHPGGYYARVSDPAGNQFEIWCESDEDEYVIDELEMPFFYSY